MVALAVTILVGIALYAYAVYQMTKNWTAEDWRNFPEFFKQYMVMATLIRAVAVLAGAFQASVTIILGLVIQLRGDTPQPP